MSSSSVPLYNDINKKFNDLLTKDFPSGIKIELKAPKRAGLGVDASTSDKDGAQVAVFTPKFQHEHHQYGTTVVSATVDTKRTFKAELSSTNFVKGLKAVLTATDSQTVSTQFEYKNPNFTTNATINLLSPKGTTGVLAYVFGYQGHAFGLQSEFNLSNRAVSDLNANITINPDSAVSLGLYGRFKKDILGARFLYAYDKDLTVGVEAEGNYANYNEIPKVTLGTEYAIDLRHTLKTKVDSVGNVSVALVTKLSDRIKAGIATTINTNSFSSNSKATFGINFTIE